VQCKDAVLVIDTDLKGRAMTEAIVADGLVKRFEQVEAVEGISFKVRPGEVFGLLGPNGAGKSITIRMLTDLTRPSAGTARVLGLDIKHDLARTMKRIGVPRAARLGHAGAFSA